MNWLLVVAVVCVAAATAEEPPQYGYDNLPVTRFTCEGKLQGRYYADPETDCQMFHVCVRMSRNEIQDYRFLCPNGTVFDQEHLVCADYYQVACHANIHGGAFGHIFEFLKLSASKDQALNLGNIPLNDPEYLGRNTLGTDDFQVEEYNNNKLAAQGNSLYNSQGFTDKDIRFPTTTTRRTTTTTTRRPTTRYTTAAPTTTTTTVSPYFAYSTEAPLDETYPSTSNYQANNLNFHRETDVPQTFPTTTRRPDYFPGSNFGFNNANTKTNNDYYTTASTTYAPPTTTTTSNYYYQTEEPTTTRRPAIFQSTFRTTLDAITTPAPYQQQNQQQTFQQQPSRFGDDYFRKLPTTEQSSTAKTQFLFYGDTFDSSTTGFPTTTTAPSTTTDFPTTTRRPAFQQQSFTSTTKNVYNTPPPRYFQSINVVTPLVPRENFDYYSTTSAPIRPTTTDIPIYQAGRSINNGPFPSQPNRSRQQQFASQKTASAPDNSGRYYNPPTTTTAPKGSYYNQPASTVAPQGSYYNQPDSTIAPQRSYYNQPASTVAPQGSYYNPTQASYSTPQYYEEQRFTETTSPTTTTTSTTETPRPRRKGRRRNPNRQGLNNGTDAGAGLRRQQNFNNGNNNPGFQYSRRIENTREDYSVQRQKTEEVFSAESSVYRGQPRGNTFYSPEPKSSSPAPEVSTVPSRSAVFGGDNFGRRIRPGAGGKTYQNIESGSGGKTYQNIERRTTTTTVQPFYEASSPSYSDPVAPPQQQQQQQQRGRVVKRLRAKSTTTTEAPAPELTLPPFSPSTPKPRVNVRTKTVYGPINPDNNNNNNANGRRVIVKKIRPSTTLEPFLETAGPADTTGSSAFKIEELPPPVPQTRNLTATVGGFKVTVISKSSDQQTSTSFIEEQTTPSYIKPSFPKLNKSFLTKKPASVATTVSTTVSPVSGDDVGSTKSPDYDYHYFNTDDEIQYVAEHNSPDRLFGNRARKSQQDYSEPASF